MNIISNRFKAILFDVDNTLYSNTMMLLSTPLRYVVSCKWIYYYYRMRKQLRKELATQSGNKKDFFEQRSFELFVEYSGLSTVLANHILQNRIKRMWIEGLKKTPLRRGMRNLIGNLYHAKYKLGIISDFMAYEKLKNWGLLSYFHCIISSETFGTLKPDRLLFDTASKQLGVANDECLYIGNHILYDGYGALDANMDCLIFSSALNRKKHLYRNITFINSVKDIYHYLVY